MFDEYGEGNQIAKAAENSSMLPTNSGMLALDEDGTPCSSDYHLRLTSDGGRMLKGQIPLTATRPTAPLIGGGDTQAPSVPSGLHVVTHTATSVSLAWTAATDNVGVIGYRIFANGGQIGVSVSTSFTTNGLTPSIGDSFTVTAQDAAGNSSPASAVASVATDPGGSTNLALNRPTAESSHTQAYTAANTVDGNTRSYWESAGNTVTIPLPASRRYLRLTFTANTGWPAGQVSEFQVCA